MLGKNRRYSIPFVVVVIAVAIVTLSAPLVAVESVTTQKRTRPLGYNDPYYNETGVPLFVNVTNTDLVGGFSQFP